MAPTIRVATNNRAKAVIYRRDGVDIRSVNNKDKRWLNSKATTRAVIQTSSERASLTKPRLMLIKADRDTMPTMVQSAQFMRDSEVEEPPILPEAGHWAYPTSAPPFA